jgi:hypothetical protein
MIHIINTKSLLEGDLNKQCQVSGQTIGKHIYLSIKAKYVSMKCIY